MKIRQEQAKEKALTRGGLRLGFGALASSAELFLYTKKSADSIVVADTSPVNESDKQGCLTK